MAAFKQPLKKATFDELISKAVAAGETVVRSVTAPIDAASKTLKTKQLEDRKVENQGKITKLKEAAAKRLAHKKAAEQVTLKA